MCSRDRDETGRPRNARARDELGRPLAHGATGVDPLPEEIDTEPAAVAALAGRLLDAGLPFQAHEALEAAWKASYGPERTAWKGMAQLAVALTHARRGNPEGSRRLRERGEGNLRSGLLPAVAGPLRNRLLAELDDVSR